MNTFSERVQLIIEPWNGVKVCVADVRGAEFVAPGALAVTS